MLTEASVLPPGQTVWTPVELEQLAQLLFTLQDHFQLNVYPAILDLHLDVEVKLTADGRPVLKQARPYTIVDP